MINYSSQYVVGGTLLGVGAGMVFGHLAAFTVIGIGLGIIMSSIGGRK